MFPVLGDEIPERKFRGAEELYREEKYAEAASAYEEILAQGVRSGVLYYNLGNAHYKTGDIGRAILNYERALRLMPNDKELNHNLGLVRDMVQDRIVSEEGPAWLQKFLGLHQRFPLNTVLILSSVCYALLFLLGAYTVLQPLFRPTFFKFFFFPLLSGFILFACLGGWKLSQERFSPAIIIAKEVDVHYGPSVHETKAFVLHAGVKCSIRNVSGEWFLIWLPDDRGGWVPKEALERI